MIRLLRNIWNKIFGNTIFGWYYDSNKKKKKKRKKNVNSSSVTTSRRNNNGLINIDVDDGKDFIDFDVIDKDTSKEEKKQVKTYTKKWVDRILTMALIDVQMVFILAFMGKENIAESLGIAIVTEILGVSIAYLIRAFFDSHSEAKDNIELEKVKRTYPVQNDVYTISDEEDNEDEENGVVG